MSINLVSLIGRLGRDPELRFFESGSCVAEFSLALDRLPKDGEPQPPAWVRCKAWNRTAQVAGDHLRKGSRVGLVGRLDTEEWADRGTGEKRSRTLVVIQRLELLDRPQGGAAGTSSGMSAGVAKAAPAEAAPSSGREAPLRPLSDEEVPF